VTAKVSDVELIEAFRRFGSPQKIADHYGMTVRQVYRRRNDIEARRGIIIASYQNDVSGRQKIELPKQGLRQLANITGTIVVFGDAHWWPGQAKSTAHRALLEVIRAVKPAMIVANGDLLDLPLSSRHPPLGYGVAPSHDVAQEIGICQEYLTEIEQAAPAECALIWNLGNHDMRLAAKLASVAPEFAAVKGARLEDHFPAWALGISLMLNGNVMIKHRPPKGGVHSTWGSIVSSGLDAIVCNHLHSLRVTPQTTYRPRRAYGVDAGCLAEIGPAQPQFDYLEDTVANWASGFVVLHINDDGTVLPPELCEVIQGRAYWRGQQVV
jgi:hypothetical protein